MSRTCFCDVQPKHRERKYLNLKRLSEDREYLSNKEKGTIKCHTSKIDPCNKIAFCPVKLHTWRRSHQDAKTRLAVFLNTCMCGCVVLIVKQDQFFHLPGLIFPRF